LSVHVAGTAVCGIPTKRRCEWKGMDVSADNRSRSWVSRSTFSCSFLVLTHTALLKFGSDLQIATFKRGFFEAGGSSTGKFLIVRMKECMWLVYLSSMEFLMCCEIMSWTLCLEMLVGNTTDMLCNQSSIKV